jgi:hypothetical protein
MQVFNKHMNMRDNRTSVYKHPYITHKIPHCRIDYAPTWILQQVSLKQIWIRLTSFMGMYNSVRISYKTSLLTKS